jgi:hypothetical protein
VSAIAPRDGFVFDGFLITGAKLLSLCKPQQNNFFYNNPSAAKNIPGSVFGCWEIFQK